MENSTSAVVMIAKTHRVKSVDLHNTQPLIACGHHTGRVSLCNYETKSLLQTFDMTEPCRCVKFIHSLNCIACGCDDCFVRVFDIITFENVATFQADSDYVRSMAVVEDHHLLLTCGDGGIVSAFDWMQDWVCVGVFKGHGGGHALSLQSAYVMSISLHPTDKMTFATASLDHTVRLWNLESCCITNNQIQSKETEKTSGITRSSNHHTTTITTTRILKGHTDMVCCVDFHPTGRVLASASDDCTVRIWDYTTQSCIQVLKGLHTASLPAVGFHPTLPLLFSISEDSTVGVYNSDTWDHIHTMKYKLNRGWTVGFKKGDTNDNGAVALGFDNGFVILSPQNLKNEDLLQDGVGGDGMAVAEGVVVSTTYDRILDARDRHFHHHQVTDEEQDKIPLLPSKNNQNDTTFITVPLSHQQHLTTSRTTIQDASGKSGKTGAQSITSGKAGSTALSAGGVAEEEDVVYLRNMWSSSGAAVVNLTFETAHRPLPSIRNSSGWCSTKRFAVFTIFILFLVIYWKKRFK